MGIKTVSMIDFPSISFQSSLGTEAILFGVFGFLYSVFGLYSSLVTPTSPSKPPIVDKLKLACRFIALLIVLNAIITIYSLISLNIFQLGLGNIFMGILFIITILGMAGFSTLWSIRYMN